MPPSLAASLSLDCDLDEIRRVGGWLSDTCKAIDPICREELELAVVEAVTNIIKHGGLAGPDQAIGLELKRHDTGVEVIITDRGNPIPEEALAKSYGALDFDPDDIENLPVHGLGLALIREATDVFDYHSAGGVNTMRLVKNC